MNISIADRSGISKTTIRRNLITNNGFLDSLPDDIKRTLNRVCRTVSLVKGQDLYHQDERIDFVYFPLTSVISEFDTLEDGRWLEISTTGRDGAVGLIPTFTDTRFAPNTTQVTQAGTAMRIETTTLRRLLKTNERAVSNNFHIIKDRLNSWLHDLMPKGSGFYWPSRDPGISIH